MPTVYQTPGIYINEVPAGSRPIEGVATSVAAFIGLAPAGPVNTARKVTSWIEFARVFGDQTPNSTNGPYLAGAYLAHAVQGFFANGGTTCYVVRVGTNLHGGLPLLELESATSDPPGKPAYTLVRRPQPSDTDPQTQKLKPVEEWAAVEVSFEKDGPQAGEKGDDSETSAPQTFKMTIKLEASGSEDDDDAGATEEYAGLTAKPGAQFFAAVLNARSQLIRVEDPGESHPYSQRIFDIPGKALTLAPATTAAAPVGPGDLEGDPATSTGVAALEGMDDVTMVCVPDLMAVTDDADAIAAVQAKVEAYCSQGKRMAIHDAPPALDKQEIVAWRKQMTAVSPFSTLYWPWIKVSDPISKAIIEVPPCGHVAGVWAETDNRRGVHKAPANELVGGAVGVATAIGNADQAALNTTGINVIRQFPGRGIRIWGARTLATQTDPEWRYINVRRLMNYVSASILVGTSWAVFEPNDELLWNQLRVSVGNFLMGIWRTGALFGSAPDEAFFVKCDRDTNPPDSVEAGQVNIYIGIAPVKPAEFVVFQISQYQPAAT